MAKQEQLGWRDERLSLRHREWGEDCPAADLDFLLIEYDDGVAKALVEFRHFNGSVPIETPSAKALRDLGDRAGLPVFFVRYDPGDWSMTIVPGNDPADAFLTPNTRMTEKEWVSFLYALRGRNAPASLLSRLNGNDD